MQSQKNDCHAVIDGVYKVEPCCERAEKSAEHREGREQRDERRFAVYVNIGNAAECDGQRYAEGQLAARQRLICDAVRKLVGN